MSLFDRDEEAFHSERIKFIEQQIISLEPTNLARQQMMRGCVYRMDRSLKKIKHPTVRFEALKNMFWDQYYTFDDTFMSGKFDLDEMIEQNPPKNKSVVISFPTKVTR